MANRGAQVLGIDLSQAVLDVAELHALENKLAIQYRSVAAEDLAAAAAARAAASSLGASEHSQGTQQRCGEH